MKYIKSSHYDEKIIKSKIMGPNPLKMNEELLQNNKLPKGSFVMDLGSGQGFTSLFLVKEYGFRVFAVDLWSNPTDNKKFFDENGLTSEQIMPIHADATNLPFADDTFDAVICTDSYNYFGRNNEYLGQKLLPFVKHGGYIYIAVPGMKKDCHDNLPKELLLSWTSEQMDYIHDINFWQEIISKTDGIEILSICEMEGNEELWNDWLSCDNPYAINDRKTMEAGGGKYMNFVAIILKKK